MKETIRKKGKLWSSQFRCNHANCRKECSVTASCSFFLRAHMPISKVMEIIHLWLYGRYTVRDAAEVCGTTQNSIVRWWSMCRNVCTLVLDNEEKYVGTADQPVQVDESFFSGRRKYGRGRLQSGDTSKNSSEEHEFDDWVSAAGSGVSIHDGPKFNEDVDSWTWVLGISESTHKVRFIRVQERDQFTLKAVLEKYIQSGSFVWTDCWKGYSSHAMDNFHHATVNHKENFVDPETGVNTQRIERAWRDAKAWYKRANGNLRYLQGHLDEAAYRKLRKADTTGQTLFQLFLQDMRRVLPGSIE